MLSYLYGNGDAKKVTFDNIPNTAACNGFTHLLSPNFTKGVR